MIVGNLTYAIVILMDVHGEAYQFSAGEKMLGGQMLREKTLKHQIHLVGPFPFEGKEGVHF